MRLLVVEDYEPLRTSICRGLRAQGYVVDTAGDGVDGLRQVKQNDYDVIVLDIMLPKLDGLSLLDRLRAAGSTARVLLLTARDAVRDRVEGLDRGADDYLIKPFAFDELSARIRTLIRRRYDKQSPVIQIDDLEINTATRIVQRGGVSIDLSAREYAMVEYLAHRQGQLVTRTAIWESLWDDLTTPMSNVVDVYIGRLRRKIDLDGQTPLLHTRRGQGYVLGVVE